MMQINVDLTDFNDKIGKFPEVIANAARKTLKQELSEVRQIAVREHRHLTRTGSLNNSIVQEVASDGLSGQVGFATNSRVKYGPYVHEGHGSKGKSVLSGYPYVWEPDRFLSAALEKREPGIQDRFEKSIYSALAEAAYRYLITLTPR